MTQEDKYKKLLGYGWKHIRSPDCFSVWLKGKLKADTIDEAWERERLLWQGAKRRVAEMLKRIPGLTQPSIRKDRP